VPFQSSELFRLRAAWDETVEQLDTVRRENKNLADEIKDLLDQLGEGGRSIHELDKQRRRLQVRIKIIFVYSRNDNVRWLSLG
jgi:myosin heavy chain 6/7